MEDSLPVVSDSNEDPGLDHNRNKFDTTTAERQNSVSSIKIRILGLEKTRKDIIIKFDYEANGKAPRQQARSYQEFSALSNVLGGKHPELIIPALPLAQTSAPNVQENDRLVMRAFHQWLTFILSTEDYQKDPETLRFLRGDFGYMPESPASRKSASNFLISTTKLAGEKEDELTLAKNDLLKFATMMGHVARGIDTVASNKRSTVHSYVELSEAFSNFAVASETEGDHTLAEVLRKSSVLFKRNAEVMNAQKASDLVILGDTTAYEAANALAARDALVHRDILIEEQRAAVNNTLTKQRTLNKLRESEVIATSRAETAAAEMKEALAHENKLTQNLVTTTKKLAPEYLRHMDESSRNLVNMLNLHASKNLKYEQRHLSDLSVASREIKQALAHHGKSSVTRMPDLSQSDTLTMNHNSDLTKPSLGTEPSSSNKDLSESMSNLSVKPKPQVSAKMAASMLAGL